MMASEGNIMTKAKLKVVIMTPIQRPIYNIGGAWMPEGKVR